MKLSSEIQDSLELRFSGLARQMNSRGERIISLGLGEPGFPTPPEVIEAAAAAMRQGMTRYSNPFGLMELRQAIAAKLAGENGIQASPDDIMVTPGAKMALSLALAALVQPGDEVVNVTPCYPSYLPQIRIAEPDCVIRNVDLLRNGFLLDLDRLADAIGPKTRAVIINFPHNPTGRMLSAAELDGLAAILARHPQCWLISDEIYERLNFSGAAHLSPAARPELDARTITINGFSKAFSMTGWRIGYLVAKGPVMKVISKLQQHMNTNVAPFIQMAALEALRLPTSFIDDYNARLAANARLLEETVAASSKLGVVPSQGGLFAFVNVAGTGMGSDAFCSALLEGHGVAATPGISFGNGWDDHVRCSLATDTTSFAEGMKRLGLFALSLSE